jgi:glutathione S-transferase
VLKFYGRSSSDSVQKALWMLMETGEAFEHIQLGGRFGGLDDPGYLKLNPHGRVPTLLDGDLAVWESNAIVRYLAAKYCSGGLWPKDPAARAVADQWMDWGQTRLYPVANKLFWLTVRTPEGEQDEAPIAEAHERLLGFYKLLEDRLADRDFLAGDRLTMADFPSGATLYRFFEMSIERPALPNIARWYERLKVREAYQRAVMVPFDELRGRLAY